MGQVNSRYLCLSISPPPHQAQSLHLASFEEGYKALAYSQCWTGPMTIFPLPSRGWTCSLALVRVIGFIYVTRLRLDLPNSKYCRLSPFFGICQYSAMT